MTVLNRALRADSELTRRRILDGARELCRQAGYENVRMADIADRVGCARATVYNHFASRDDVLEALCKEYLDGYLDLFEGIREWLDLEHSVFDVLRETVATELRWRVAHDELRGALDSAKRLRKPFYVMADQRIDDALLAWFGAIYGSAERHGLLREGLDIEFASRPIYAMLDSVVAGFPVSMSADAVERAADKVARLQWHALFPLEPERSPRFADLEVDVKHVAGVRRGPAEETPR